MVEISDYFACSIKPCLVVAFDVQNTVQNKRTVMLAARVVKLMDNSCTVSEVAIDITVYFSYFYFLSKL